MRDRQTRGGIARTSAAEWVGGKILAPMWITEPEPRRAELFLWLEIPDELIVKFELLDPQRPVGFARTLLDAMRAPLIGAPRQPRRVRVADETLAAELRTTLGDRLPVLVAPTPELDRVVQTMAQTLPGEGESPSYLENGRVSEECAASLFRTARMLYDLAPWKDAADSQLLRVDVPELDIRGACLSIIGALGESFGFILFDSVETWERFAELAESGFPEDGPIDFGGNHLALTFEPADNLPPEMRREVAAYGWEVAGPVAYPRVEHRERDGMPRPLNERDVRLAVACAGALAALFLRHREIFADEFMRPVSETYEGDGTLAVRITAPYEAFDGFEDAPAVVGGPRTPRVGRNDPCPCGSGRKYKKCHLGRDDELRSSAGRPETPHDLGRRLIRKILDDTAPELSRQWIPFLARHGFADAPPEFVLPWLLHDVPWSGRSAAARYREAAGNRLSDRERAWLDAEAQAWLSVWEVTAVEAGSSVTVKDLLTGTTRRVTEREGSKSLTFRDAVLGRVVDFEDQSFFDGLYPRRLPPFEAAEIVRRARTRLRLRRDVPAARLRDPKIGPHMIGDWMDTVEELEERWSVPPKLANMDGDDLLFTVDHFDLDPTVRSQVEERLAGLEGASRSIEDDGTTVVRFERAGKVGKGCAESVTVGVARVSERGLELETNSVRRADDLRRRVESVCGDLVRHRIREHTDPRAEMKRGDRPAGKTVPLEGPEVDGFIRQHKEQHYAAWLDEPLPALSGRTPREAGQTRDGRERLAVLLKNLENTESRAPEGQRFDVSILRRALGVAG